MDVMESYVLTRLDEMRDLLKHCHALLEAQTGASKSPLMASLAEPPASKFWSRVEWMLSAKPILWLLQMLVRLFPAAGTLLYLLATGQHGKIIAYLNGLLGL